APGQRLCHRGGNDIRQRAQLFGIGYLFIQRLLEVPRIGVVVIAQHEVVVIQQLAELGGETLTLVQVAETHTAARYLVFIGRTDAATSGADRSEERRVGRERR